MSKTKVCELCGAEYDPENIYVHIWCDGTYAWVKTIEKEKYVPSLCKNCLRAAIYGVSLKDDRIFLIREPEC